MTEGEGRPYLSVIVCTLNRYDSLTTCLDALAASAARTQVTHEIIVVDQTDPPARRSDLTQTYPGVRLVYQDERGLSKARNFGFAASRGAIVAYLDDDAVPCEKWMTEIAAPFLADEEERFAACGGRVVADYRDGAKPGWMTANLEHYLSCIDWGGATRTLRPGEWIVGANMAFRRKVLEHHQLFNVALGRNGAAHLLSNEEIGLMERIGRERVLYSPFAEVLHVINPERLEQKWFRRRAYWQAISDQLAGVGWLPQSEAWTNFSSFIARSPAERRSMLALFDDCPDAERFSQQLSAIYALTMLGSEGFCIPE
jgi:glycosyltransferase involved in cell wall biosynthesis